MSLKRNDKSGAIALARQRVEQYGGTLPESFCEYLLMMQDDFDVGFNRVLYAIATGKDAAMRKRSAALRDAANTILKR